ncbi:hypothetical protein [Arenibaculum pallidiluteum]|uniref:hypothetical protein n=1 Tax=Arenibaculum pallidiluteum TaxID=2812559 RepID=UPI001A96780A|nr:hypothetical protein [Arenibaculum pallidiluteum]
MDWVTVIAAVVIVASLACAALIGVLAGDLRRHLRRNLVEAAARQDQIHRRLAEELGTALRRIEELQGTQRKMAAQIADLYDRVSEDRTGSRRAGNGERWLN